MREIQTYVDTSRFVRVILAKVPYEIIPYWYNSIRPTPEESSWSAMCERVGIQPIILIGGQWTDFICFWLKLGVCARIFFLIQPSQVFALSESFQNCETMRNTLPGRLEVPTLRLTASRSNQLSYGSRCSFGCTLSNMCLICSVLLSSVLCCFVLCCCVGSLAVRCWLCFVHFFCVLCFPCGSRLSIAVLIHSVVVLF